jgi:septal ring factor EnvC (AmiA/AmiB activator)
LKRRKKSLTREIELLNRSLRKTSNNKSLSLKQINALNAQIRLREEKINTINSEINLLDNQISDNTHTVYTLQGQLTTLKKEYAGMVNFAYKNQNAYNKLMFVFASQSFNQAYKRLKYLSQFTRYRKKQAEYIQKTKNLLQIKIVQLDHNKKEKSNLLEDEKDEKETLGKEKEKQSVVLNKLSKQEQELARQLAKKKKESARLNRAIQNAIGREIEAARKKEAARIAAAAARARAKAKANSGSKTPVTTKAKVATVSKGSAVLAATPETAKLSSSFLGNRGHLPWPVASGSIVEGYGRHSYGVNVTIENNGIDIKTGKGAAVRAIYSGQVTTVQDIGGNFAVLIRHGEYFTVYSNLRTVSVSKGQKIDTKQSIGTVSTDSSDGTTQLHFEIRKGASPLNPSSWLAR